MSKVILQAVLDQIDDVIEATRQSCPREEHIFDEPRHSGSFYLYDTSETNGKEFCSRRWIYATDPEHKGMCAGYEWWPALEPLHKLARRVSMYIKQA